MVVFVLSSDAQPLDPCHERRARKLLKAGRAVVHRTYPFTIRLKDRTFAEAVVHQHRLKLDPGSKTSGLAIVQEGTERVVWAGELSHRGQQIRDALLRRRQIRRTRRQRRTCYRKARFLNRRRSEGWLPPSLNHRVLTTLTWGRRQMCRTDKHGFPMRHVARQKVWFGFRTGDLVKAVVPNGKYAGVHIGRITIRARRMFRLNGMDVHAKHLRLLQRADGYAYATRKEERHCPAR